MSSFLARSIRPALILTALGGLGAVLHAQRDALAAVDWGAAPTTLVSAAVLLAAAPLLQALTWRWALAATGALPAWTPTLRVWARSFLLRYEPSGAVGYAYRVHARDQVGATTPQVLVASAYEQLAAVLAGALVGVGAFVLAGLEPPVLAWAAAGGALAITLLARPALLGRLAARRLAAHGVGVDLLLPGRAVAGMALLHLPGWVLTGLGAQLAARAVGVEVDPALLLGAFALSWLVGVLVPLAPGGLGLRDASLVVSLGVAVGAGPATVLALALRVLSLGGELLAAALLEAGAWVLTRRGAARVPLAAPLPGRSLASTRRSFPEAPRTVVVVPTYDELEALPLFLERFAATGHDLLIVDDDSPDGTGALADRLAAERPWMHVLHRTSKDGLGLAYRAGFTWALAAGYDLVGQMDCDLSHPPEALAALHAARAAQDADLVIANRYLPGGGTDGWSRGRRLLSRLGCAGSKLVLGLPFDDLSGGFKLWRADALAALDFDAMLATGYAFQVETTLLTHLGGGRIAEVPFVFSERIAGASKMSLAISLEGIRVTLGLRRRHRALRTG